VLELQQNESENFMKNIEVDPEDTLRPEYKRSVFGELIRGKYATTQVDFHHLPEHCSRALAKMKA
jgi:hypothetical protein